MHNEKKLLQPINNSVWTTNDVLKCDSCNKRVPRIVNFTNKEKTYSIDVCFKCLIPALESSFFETEEDFILAREIEDINFLYRKSTRKNERGKLTNSLRYLCLKKSQFKCQACGISASESPLEIDHVQPISKGGQTILENLQALCQPCNSGKGAL